MHDEYLNIESDDDLLKVLGKSTFLTKQEAGDVTISLYYYNDFFIETFYNNVLEMYVVISAFLDVKQLQRHLEAIGLKDLI